MTLVSGNIRRMRTADIRGGSSGGGVKTTVGLSTMAQFLAIWVASETLEIRTAVLRDDMLPLSACNNWLQNE